MTREVVVTGIGAITAAGTGVIPFKDTLKNGKSCVCRIDHFETNDLQCKIGAFVPDFRATDYMTKSEAQRLNRGDQLFAAAGQMALQSSKLSIDPYKTGICQGTSIGGLPDALENYEEYLKYGYRWIHPLTMMLASPGLGGSQISRMTGIKGPVYTFSNGTVSSAYAIASAFRQITTGELDAVIAGGGDSAMNRPMFLMFQRSKILSTKWNHSPEKAYKPFDLQRDGFVLGEGAAAVVLESKDQALKRGADILAVLKGVSLTCDAESFVAPEVHPVQKARAMNEVINLAGIDNNDVDYISAHGTGTKLNDPSETKAVKMAFGSIAYDVPVSAMKSMIGHTLGACSAIELVGTIIAMREGFLPPTINLTHPDPDCDLDYVANTSRKKIIKNALVNNSGFGGRNSSILVAQDNGV